MGVVREFGIGPFGASATAWLTRPQERPTPATPRLAATVMLMRGAPLEVFMIERASTMEFAPSSWVFPGGGVDELDYRTDAATLNLDEAGMASWLRRSGTDDAELATALLTAATRELFEEAGVLLASAEGESIVSTTGPDADEWAARRQQLEAHEIGIAEVLDGLRMRPDLLALVDRWITPEMEKRRFDAWFFAALLPDGAQADAVSRESQRGAWVRPSEMLAKADAGELQLLPPTRTALTRMLRSSDAAGELAAAQQSPPVVATRPLPVMGPDGPFLRAEVNL